MDDISRHMATDAADNIHLNRITEEKVELLESMLAMVFGAAGDGHLEARDALEMVRFIESWRSEVLEFRDSWVPPSHWAMAELN